eukprot:scaffold75317_cov50-Phaeocystis_antarctica.AAC.1
MGQRQLGLLVLRRLTIAHRRRWCARTLPRTRHLRSPRHHRRPRHHDSLTLTLTLTLALTLTRRAPCRHRPAAGRAGGGGCAARAERG